MLGRALVPVLAALAVAGAGCGGSDPEEPVRDYLLAIVEGDGAAACEQLTEELRAQIEQAPAASGRGCADVMELAAGLNPALTASEVEELEIEVSEDGDEATATLTNPLVGREETIDLVKENGDWKIATLQTAPSG